MLHVRYFGVFFPLFLRLLETNFLADKYWLGQTIAPSTG